MELPLDMVGISASSCRTIIVSRVRLLVTLCQETLEIYFQACNAYSSVYLGLYKGGKMNITTTTR